MCSKKQNHIKPKAKTGFTIVEVTLVTAFVAMLLITITIIITNISAIFQKGLTLKEVNSVGRNLVEELTKSINAASSLDTKSLCEKFLTDHTAIDTCKEDNAYKFIFQEQFNNSYTMKVAGVSETPFTAQYNGIFCSGEYSYIWNTHYGIREDIEHGNGNYTLALKYLDTYRIERDAIFEKVYDSVTGEIKDNERPFRILRIKDLDYLACASRIDPSTYEYKAASASYDPQVVNVMYNLAIGSSGLGRENLIEDPIYGFLDGADDLQLQLYELTMFPPGQDSITQRAFFAGTFVLATDLGNVNIARSGDYCDPSGAGETEAEDSASNISNLGSNFNYCAINKFNFAARTAGSGIIK